MNVKYTNPDHDRAQTNQLKMPPNAMDSNFNTDTENNINNLKDINHSKKGSMENDGSYYLKIFQSSLSLLAHLLIGFTVGASILFAFRNGSISTTGLHVVMCVIGYQLLMAEAILCLCPNSGWADSFRLVDKKRAHWILQVAGSVLGIVGSIIKSLDKPVNWNTLHGQFGLVAIVFTAVSLVNGLTSLYAYEFRRYLPGRLSKITHILFGTIAFAASGISLCYGFDKHRFIEWATPNVTYVLIGFTACFTFIIIINPAVTFFNKTLRVFNN